MDFFEAQDSAHRHSRTLLLLFLVAVVALICAVYLTLLLALGLFAGGGGGDPRIFGLVAVGMILLIGGGSAYRTAQLRRGGAAVAEMLGGRRIEAGTSDPAEQRLRNVVEEMSIAAGVPVPEIFVLDAESGINAFAAGHSQHDAAVAMSRGALERLDRDELQGVVAHEFSHILNGDMQLNIRLIGILFGIFLLAVTGRGILRGSGRRRGKGNAQIVLMGVALLVLGYIGVFVGRLIQAAVSRQREFLADASAVQFTRNPDGIAGALRKIEGEVGSRILNHHAQELAHLFFADGMSGAFVRAMATHPPLEERIRRLDPRGTGALRPQTGDPVSAISAYAGSPTTEHLDRARNILIGIPTEMREAARNPSEAKAILLGILAAGGGTQIAGSEVADGLRLLDDLSSRAKQWSREIEVLGASARLPLLDLTLPALRTLPEPEARELFSTVSRMILLDGRILPFEFAIYHTLRRHLQLGTVRRSEGRRRQAHSREPSAIVLSAVAWAGSGAEEQAKHSFEVGTREDGGVGRLLPPGACGLVEVDSALHILEESPPQLRKRLLDTAQAIVQADRRIDISELEMLRAIAEALDVPIPPLVACNT